MATTKRLQKIGGGMTISGMVVCALSLVAAFIMVASTHSNIAPVPLSMALFGSLGMVSVGFALMVEAEARRSPARAGRIAARSVVVLLLLLTVAIAANAVAIIKRPAITMTA